MRLRDEGNPRYADGHDNVHGFFTSGLPVGSRAAGKLQSSPHSTEK
jgi:hypothetical protein